RQVVAAARGDPVAEAFDRRAAPAADDAQPAGSAVEHAQAGADTAAVQCAAVQIDPQCAAVVLRADQQAIAWTDLGYDRIIGQDDAADENVAAGARDVLAGDIVTTELRTGAGSNQQRHGGADGGDAAESKSRHMASFKPHGSRRFQPRIASAHTC